jgi:plastocyanin
MNGMRNFTVGGALFLASLAVFTLAFYGGVRIMDLPPLTVEDQAEVAPSTSLEITSRNILFDKRVLAAPANTEITVTHHNLDAGVLHNVAFYRTRAAQDRIYVQDLYPGVETRTDTFTTPGPGNYFYRCDAHPDTMTGTFVVVP